jgi:hypothetical protein
VTSTAHAPGVDLAGQPHEQEVHLLVELLRSSRLSLLHAEPGSDKTALLRFGLIPMLSRRAGDQLVPASVRASGVVVPFPDRRSRSSSRTSKRRREVVVYCGDWTDPPLAALQQSLWRSVAAAPVDGSIPSRRLSVVLEELSQRFDANFIVLLDRFEDLLLAGSQTVAIDQFTNELAEAINQEQLPANFLIALAAGANSGLADLRTRIHGFDDSSLRLAPPRDSTASSAPQPRREPTAPAMIEALPILTETLAVPPTASPPVEATAPQPMIRAPRSRKAKRPPLPRLQIKTEDVYAMIEAALSRIAVRTAGGPSLSAPSQPGARTSGTPTRGRSLQEAIERMERRLGITPEGE